MFLNFALQSEKEWDITDNTLGLTNSQALAIYIINNSQKILQGENIHQFRHLLSLVKILSKLMIA